MFEAEIETLSKLLTSVEFLAGFAAGLAILVLTALSPTTRSSRAFGYATMVTAVLVLAMYVDFGRRLGSFLGLVLIAISAWALDNAPRVTSRETVVPWIGLIAGAVVFAWRSGLDSSGWAIAAIPVFTVAIGTSLIRLRDIGLGTLIGPFLGIAAIGVWATLPDTEMAAVLVGCTLPLLAVTPHPIEARVTATGSFALAAAISWIAVQGGAQREAAIVGAMGCFLTVLILALVVRAPVTRIRGGATALIGAHVVNVIVSSRVIGLGDEIGPAVASIAFLAVVLIVPIRWIVRPDASVTR